MNKKEKKKTITRVVTPKQHAALLWILENQERYSGGEIIDLSRYSNVPDTKEKHRYYVSQRELELINHYLCYIDTSSGKFEDYIKDWQLKEEYKNMTQLPVIKYE